MLQILVKSFMEVNMRRITLIPGDGIGPEITEATQVVLESTGLDLEWELVSAGADAIEKNGTPLPEKSLQSIRKNKIALKGPLTTPLGSGFRSINVAIRKELDLFANLRPSSNLPGVKSLYGDVDLVVVRENTEGEYSGVEHFVGSEAAETIKIITRKASERIVRFAFNYAVNQNRKKVTLVHKANIMKYTDGLFLHIGEEVAKEYPDILFEDKIVDNMAMQLVQKPEQYDVIVTTNMYGDILSDLCAGLVGGLGVAPGANIGEGQAVFEPVHGSAPKYAGKNIANPLAMILSGVMMINYLGHVEVGDAVLKAVKAILEKKEFITKDLGGKAGTYEMGQAIAKTVRQIL